MQRYQRHTILLLLFLCARLIWAASPLDGDWLGGFERAGSYVYVHTHFAAATNGTTGTIDVIDSGDRFTVSIDWPLHKLQLTPLRVHFDLADKPGPHSVVAGSSSPLSFEGQVTNGVMTGVVEDKGNAPCVLARGYHLSPLRGF